METAAPDILSVVQRALREDIGRGDVTTNSIFPDDVQATGSFVAKAPGVVAGLPVAEMVFAELDPACRLTVLIPDGAAVTTGTTIATISGPVRALLTGERTALNFLQRMSGIATATHAFVEAVAGTGCTVLDTRKTAPGLRETDKMAVRIGGGQNHRRGLDDMALIKDNHIDAAGSITQAVEHVRQSTPDIPIEVECRTLTDVEEALPLHLDRIMLDNMDLDTIRQAVRLVAGRTPLEVSGNVSLDTVRLYAETGVTHVSVGSLTHSVRALDISFLLNRTV